MGTQTTMPCVQAEDSGLLGLLQSPNWVKVCLISTIVFLPVSIVPRVEKTHLHCYNVFWARKPCQIDDLLPTKFRTQMASPIQNILTKNLETICRVILAMTSQKMIVNLLMMVLISLPIIKFICQHHVSGCVCLVWHLGFFSPIDSNNVCCKTFDHCTLFGLKTLETNT